MTRTIESTFLFMARSRLVVHLAEQIRSCVRALTPDELWWRPNANANAVGNLVLHCAGSTRYYIGHIVGGHADTRDRDAEFSAREPHSGEALLAQLDGAMHEADTVLRALDPAALLEPTTRSPKPSTYLQVIGLQLVHVATHTGQIVYITKQLRPEAVNELWRSTPSH